MKRISLLIALVVVLTMIGTLGAAAQGGTPEATLAVTQGAGMGVRNIRYCEILPVVVKDKKLVASVYNTLGLNDCPTDAWKAMDVAAIKKQFNAVEVLMNGPRFWMMDQIIGNGASASGEPVMIGGLGFIKRAETVLTLSSLKSVPYQERNIERETQYMFEAGKPVYELVSPEGYTYVMQTYAQLVDTKLSMEDLPALGSRLKLPTGWKYQEVMLDKTLVLTANGVAHLVQDDFENSYQRIEPTDLAAPTQEAPTAAPTAS